MFYIFIMPLIINLFKASLTISVQNTMSNNIDDEETQNVPVKIWHL